MLLRRVIGHLRKQEWTAIGIDFVIVVVGVFVATQVADWSAHEADKRRGNAYAQRLIAEIEGDLTRRHGVNGYLDAVNEGAIQANALLQHASPDPRALVLAAYRATEYAYASPSRATWDEIVSSGDIGLLPPNAASVLTRYFSVDEMLDARETLRSSPYRLRVRRTISFEVQDAIRRGCSDVRNDGVLIGFVTDCRLEGVSEAEIAGSALALRRDPEVRADLRNQLSELSAIRADLEGDVTTLESALAALRVTQ